jgi:hypothetical protein
VSTVARYMVKQRKPSSPSWRAFLANHVKDLVAIDFFTVPTATFGVPFGFLVLAPDRLRVLHFNVTANPSVVVETVEHRLPHGWTPEGEVLGSHTYEPRRSARPAQLPRRNCSRVACATCSICPGTPTAPSCPAASRRPSRTPAGCWLPG